MGIIAALWRCFILMVKCGKYHKWPNFLVLYVVMTGRTRSQLGKGISTDNLVNHSHVAAGSKLCCLWKSLHSNHMVCRAYIVDKIKLLFHICWQSFGIASCLFPDVFIFAPCHWPILCIFLSDYSDNVRAIMPALCNECVSMKSIWAHLLLGKFTEIASVLSVQLRYILLWQLVAHPHCGMWRVA